MSTQHNVSSNVRAYRRRQGITQQQLADLCGFRVSYISRVEREAQNLTMDSLDSLARGLGVTPEDLVKASTVVAFSEETVTVEDEVREIFIQVCRAYKNIDFTMRQVRDGMVNLIDYISQGERINFKDTENTELTEKWIAEVLGAVQIAEVLLKDMHVTEGVFEERKSEIDQISDTLADILENLPLK